MTIHCSGLTCSNKVQRAGQFCSSCDVPEPAADQVQNISGSTWPSVATIHWHGPNCGHPRRVEPDPVQHASEAESKSAHQLRMELWQAAYKLALGPIKERSAALETVINLARELKGIQ